MKNSLTRISLSLAILMMVCGVFTSGCTKKSGDDVAVREVSAMEAAGALRNGFAVLVDVREKDEIADGMAEPATWMPTSKAVEGSPEWEKFVSGLPKDKEIIVYCAAGGRAGEVAEKLAKESFKVANMGGFKDWKAAGLPTKKP